MKATFFLFLPFSHFMILKFIKVIYFFFHSTFSLVLWKKTVLFNDKIPNPSAPFLLPRSNSFFGKLDFFYVCLISSLSRTHVPLFLHFNDLIEILFHFFFSLQTAINSTFLFSQISPFILFCLFVCMCAQ